jgi:hypothetical protein
MYIKSRKVTVGSFVRSRTKIPSSWFFNDQWFEPLVIIRVRNSAPSEHPVLGRDCYKIVSQKSISVEFNSMHDDCMRAKCAIYFYDSGMFIFRFAHDVCVSL